jgi:hypothetical protein
VGFVGGGRKLHTRGGQLDRELVDELVRYTPRPAVVKKIDPYCGIIQARLEEFPRLSAKRLFDEIRAAGSRVVTSAAA